MFTRQLQPVSKHNSQPIKSLTHNWIALYLSIAKSRFTHVQVYLRSFSCRGNSWSWKLFAQINCKHKIKSNCMRVMIVKMQYINKLTIHVLNVLFCTSEFPNLLDYSSLLCFVTFVIVFVIYSKILFSKKPSFLILNQHIMLCWHDILYTIHNMSSAKRKLCVWILYIKTAMPCARNCDCEERVKWFSLYI